MMTPKQLLAIVDQLAAISGLPAPVLLERIGEDAVHELEQHADHIEHVTAVLYE